MHFENLVLFFFFHDNFLVFFFSEQLDFHSTCDPEIVSYNYLHLFSFVSFYSFGFSNAQSFSGNCNSSYTFEASVILQLHIYEDRWCWSSFFRLLIIIDRVGWLQVCKIDVFQFWWHCSIRIVSYFFFCRVEQVQIPFFFFFAFYWTWSTFAEFKLLLLSKNGFKLVFFIGKKNFHLVCSVILIALFFKATKLVFKLASCYRGRKFSAKCIY